jgi:hypothetical protein
MPLAIDARERRVVGVIVARGVGNGDPCSVEVMYHVGAIRMSTISWMYGPASIAFK